MHSAFLLIKIQNTSKAHRRRYGIDMGSFRDFHLFLPANPKNPNHNNILISPVNQRTQRHIINGSTINISFPMELLIFKNRKNIGACQKKILNKLWFCFFNINIQLPKLIHIKCQHIQINGGISDFLFIHTFCNQLL